MKPFNQLTIEEGQTLKKLGLLWELYPEASEVFPKPDKSYDKGQAYAEMIASGQIHENGITKLGNGWAIYTQNGDYMLYNEQNHPIYIGGYENCINVYKSLHPTINLNDATCGACGKPMRFNVPRLGANGGFVHSHSNKLECDLPLYKHGHGEWANKPNKNVKVPTYDKLSEGCDPEEIR